MEEENQIGVPMDENGISINAINGNQAKATLKIVGNVKKRKLTILIDSCSTHSFLDCDIARELNCEVLETTPWIVTIVDGGRLQCNLKCPCFS